jgi:hypothetical protein
MKNFRKYIIYLFILVTFVLKGQPTGYTNVGSEAFTGSDGGTITEKGNGNTWVGATRTTSFNDFEFTSTKWTGSSTGGTAGAIIFRWTNSSNFYAITYQNAGHRRVIAIKKNNLDNSNTTNALASVTVGSNVAIKVRVVGDSIKVDIGNNGSWEMAVKDGSHSSGSIGFMKNGRWDDGVKWETATWAQVVSCTVGAASSSPTVCVNSIMTSITHTTTGVTAVTSSTGLPAGVTASYVSNTVTISGTPTASGIFNYEITLTGCTTKATGTITVNAQPGLATASNGSRCGTGTVSISVTSVPVGTTIDWYAAASGGAVLAGGTGTTAFTTPSIAATTTYYAQTRNTTTGCVSASRTAVIATVNPLRTVSVASSVQTLCVNTELIDITHTTTEVTAITSSSGLPEGVVVGYGSNTITIIGTPTEIGVFNYTITPNGCGIATATGTITVEECITLPVELIYFKGEQKDTLINLNWETASEINSDYFEILHSIDNINFQIIGKVNTSGNSNVSKKYNLPHSYPEHGVNYYKLRECDIDGNYSDYKSIFVEFKIIRQTYDFIIYPNPNNNVSVNLKTNYIGEINIQIFDVEGKSVYQELINVTNQKVNLIENINLRPGIYNILINSSNNYFSIKHIKLIIRQ